MFKVQPRLPFSPRPEKIAPTVLLAALHPCMESIAEEAAAQHAHVAVTKTAPALETQQLDNSAEEAAIDEVRDTLDKFDAEHPHTGPLHVYLLDGQSAALMDQENGDTPVKALVNAAMRDPRRTIAALMPQDETYKVADDISPSTLLRQLANTILSTEGITVLVGKAAFESFIKDPDAYLAAQAINKGTVDA